MKKGGDEKRVVDECWVMGIYREKRLKMKTLQALQLHEGHQGLLNFHTLKYGKGKVGIWMDHIHYNTYQ